MKEIFLNESDEFAFLVLMSGFVVSFYYDEELIAPGTPLVLKIKLSSKNDEISSLLCSCVSHDGKRLVLV